MNEQEIFIGRGKELKIIEEMVCDPTEARHVFRIVGPGGVGKTWLLREVYRRYSQDERFVVVRVDFTETRFQSLQAVYFHIMEQFEPYLLDPQQREYRIRLSEIDKFQDSGLDVGRIEQKEDEVYRFGIDLVNRQMTAKNKRVLLLIDTVETIVTTEHGLRIKDRINSFLVHLENTILIIAARPTENVTKMFSATMNLEGWYVHDSYELHPFSGDETARYLEKNLSSQLPEDLRDKITLLTGGNPVLVAIAGEWLKRHVELPDDVDLSLEDLQTPGPEDLAERRKRFEFELVDKVRTLGQSIDWAVLYLAFLDRRYDPKILQLVLMIDSEARLQEIIQELRTLVFVRKSMSAEGGLLHDEAKRLFRQHAWPVVDPDGKIRRDLAQKVIDGYYLPEIARLDRIIQEKVARNVEQATTPGYTLDIIPDEEWLRRELQIECLDYHIRVSDEVGRSYFEKIFDEALTFRSISQLDALIQVVHNIKPAWTGTVEFQIQVARTKLVKGEIDDAAHIAQESLKHSGIRPTDAIWALDVLSGNTTDLETKVAYLQEALKRAEEIQDSELQAKFRAKFHNYIGLAYRQHSRWDEAEKSYQKALAFLDEQHEPIQCANTWNNLAFVRMLKGDLHGADNAAEQALEIRKIHDRENGLALSYSTKGRIAEEKGNYLEARRYYKVSVDLFTQMGQKDEAAKRKINLAAGQRGDGNYREAHRLLNDALESLRDNVRSIALYHQAKVFWAEAKFLDEQGEPPEKTSPLYQRSRRSGEEAFEYARKTQDVNLQARVLLDLALNVLFHQKSEDTESIRKLQDILKEYDFPREEGRLMELRGDLAYFKNDFVPAFEYYLNALEILSRHNEVVVEQTLSRVRQKFLRLSRDVRNQICQMVMKNVTNDSIYPLKTVKKLCDDVLSIIS